MTTLVEEKEATKKVTRDVTSLRKALEFLQAQGDVLTTDVEVNPDLEITGLQKHLDGGPVLLFNHVKGKPHARAITNLFADINVVDKMFGFQSPTDRVKKIAHALTHPLKPAEVPQSDAPCQEEVLTEDLDVNKYITAIRHTALESELTVGSGISCVVGEYFNGGSHIRHNPTNFPWGNVGTLQAAPGPPMWQHITAPFKGEKPHPPPMCVGLPPACPPLA